MPISDDFDPYLWTVEQQRAPLREFLLTEMIRDALRSEKPSLIGAFLNPDTGEPLYPRLAEKNARLLSKINA